MLSVLISSGSVSSSSYDCNSTILTPKSLKMKKYLSISFLLLFLFQYCSGQNNDRKIAFPHLADYLTLKTDLHIHTVFSDGSVWPDIRIQEAIKDGLDAISLTEHLEYQPHIEDIPHPDRNRSYEIATELAKPHDLLIIHGAEITRSMPPGHSNALFINDANKLMIEDSLAVFEEANRQGAFVFWNHPDWMRQQADGIAKLSDFHKLLIQKKLLHGIEVVNDLTYSEDAQAIAISSNLTSIGTSDIHGLIDYQFRLDEGGHRPVTLVFAKERSLSSLKEALFAGRTVAWYNNLLVGKEVWLKSIIEESLSFRYESYIGPTAILQVKISNRSDAHYILRNTSEFRFQKHGDIVEVPPHSSFTLLVKTLDNKESIELSFDVLNATMGKGLHPSIIFQVNKEDDNTE